MSFATLPSHLNLDDTYHIWPYKTITLLFTWITATIGLNSEIVTKYGYIYHGFLI